MAVVTVLRNPDLRSERIRAKVADAQVFEARLLPDPAVNLAFEPVLSGPDSLPNIVGAIAEEINALRTRHVRVQGAAASARQVRLDLAWSEWQTAGQARIQAVRMVLLKRALALAEANHAAAADLLQKLLRASSRGDIGGEQVQTARAAEIETAQQLRTTAKDLGEASGELNRLLGVPPDTVIALADVPLPGRPPNSESLFRLAQTQRLDLQALRAGYESQEAAVHLAVLNQFPNLNLGISANRDTSGNKILGENVDFTLPAWNRNRGQIAVQQATRAALKAEFEARLFQTRSEISKAVEGLRLAWSTRAEVVSQLPALRKFAEASARAAARGDLSQASAKSAADALRDKELLLVQTEQSIIEQTIALELLTGMPRQDWPA